MNRRSIITGAVAVAFAELIHPVSARRRGRHGSAVFKQSMTWKGTPLWSVDGTDVDVSFGYDDVCLSGQIAATLQVPIGKSATLIQDDTPTKWTVTHSSLNVIRVTATFPTTTCSGQQVGIDINPSANSHGWDRPKNPALGVYNTQFFEQTV